MDRSVSLVRVAATVGLLALVVIVSLDIWSQAGAPKAASGVSAPDFRLRKLDGSGSLALSTLRGRVVVASTELKLVDAIRTPKAGLA